MNYYLFNKEKTLQVIDKIKNELNKNQKNLNEAFQLDYAEWDYSIEFEKIIDIIDSFSNKEYLPFFSNQHIIDGIGKIILICNQNPYLILNFILSAIFTNNKVTVQLERKMLATNKAIIETIKKCIKNLKLDLDTVEYIESNSRDDVIDKQDDYDLLYYFGNKVEYLSFIKRLHIDSKYENFGEVYVYIDSKDFKDEFINIDKYCYLNEMKAKYFKNDIKEAIKQINEKNNINKFSVIFTKNSDNAYEFIKNVKTENVYVNVNPCQDFKYETNLNNLVYNKKIKK